MFIHIILVIVITFQVVLLYDSDNKYAKAEEGIFYRLFFNEAVDLSVVFFEKIADTFIH